MYENTFFCFWISKSGSKSLFVLRCACGFAGMGVSSKPKIYIMFISERNPNWI
jgi:hypothetical protein